MKQVGLLLLPVILVLSCGSKPPPTVEPAHPAEVTQAVIQPPPPAYPLNVEAAPESHEVFDPTHVSAEKYTTTMHDIQDLISDLNRIIRAKNYFEWLGYLSNAYLGEISSEEFLTEKTEELYNRDMIVASNTGRNPRQVQKRILKNPRDYFDNVVVPSRTNDHVDDIDFVSEFQIKAYTVDTRGNRLILYNLELIGNKWMIMH
jgi:hypothetical protein